MFACPVCGKSLRAEHDTRKYFVSLAEGEHAWDHEKMPTEVTHFAGPCPSGCGTFGFYIPVGQKF